ncbi:MAG TPA: hypothetical protein VGD88_12930 [Opitutaceae bacterium]
MVAFSRRSCRLVHLLACLSAGSAIFLSGCASGVAPSKTTTGAGVGALGGGAVGAVVGSNSSMGTTTGVLGGAAAGAIVGGIVGLTQEIKERKEQDRLAQERAYQQELSRKRAEEAKIKAAMDEELAAAQGFRISDMELAEAQGRVENASERLKRLQDERSAAIAKKKALDEANERLLTTEAEIARLEEELARLKSDTPLVGSTPTGDPVTTETLPLADAPRT